MKVFVYVCCAIGAFFLVLSFFPTNAINQASLALTACAFPVIPYVIFRMKEAGELKAHQQELIELLKNQQ